MQWGPRPGLKPEPLYPARGHPAPIDATIIDQANAQTRGGWTRAELHHGSTLQYAQTVVI